MDNVPKADEPISESTVDSTMGIVSRNMVVNDDTTDVGKNIGGENSTVVLAKNTNAGKSEKKRKNGFFSRLSNFRFSLRNKSKSSSSKNNNNKTAESAADSSGRKNKKSESATVDAADTSRDFIYIPLKEPPRAQRDDIRGNNENCLSDENKVNDYQHSPRLNQRSSLCGSIGNGSGGVTDYYHSVGNNKVHSKPPLPKQPPRVVGVCAKRYGESTHAPRASSTPREIDGNHRYMGTVVPTEQYRRHQRPGTTMISENKIGLIETNLDTHETIITGKTQSLMELGSRLTHPNVLTSEIHSTMSSDEPKRPHKSMEFLLDKENQRYTLENTHDYNSDSESSLSRTSSLIQFESLEKQLQSESQLYSSSPLLFTYDSIDNKYSNSLSAPPYKGATSLDTDKVNRNIVLTDNFFYNSDKTFKTTTGNFSYYNHYVSTGNDSDSLIETSGTSNESDDSIKKCSCTIRGVVDETALGTKGKSSLENLSEDSGYCEHSIQLRHKNHQSPTKYETDIITPILSCAKQFCRRPVSDPTNGPRYSTYLRQQHCSSPQMNDDRKKATYLCGVCELCGAGKENGDRGVCKCSKLMCRDENEISLATSGVVTKQMVIQLHTTNLDLNNFRFPHRSKAPQIAQPKPANVTASCNNLTALDYSEDYYGGLRINKMSSHRRNTATQPRVYIENPEITLMDEISYNFDRNLSIMNDKRDDYEPSLDEPTVGVLCIKPPQPPPRAGKKLTIPSASSPTKTKSTSKDSLTFDRDPTNLVTCYAASLERCNFELADSLSALPQVSDSENELPSYRYNFTVQQHRGLVLSTPNLSSYEHCGGEKRSSVVEDEVSGKKEDREKVFVPGILNTTTSKGSLFKEVSFHPIVSEISWKHQHSHESESPDDEEDDLDDFEHSNDTEEDSDDEDEKHDPPKICKTPPPPAAPVKSQCGETINYSSSARENNQQGHVIAIDRVNVLSDRDSKIMDNVPKADEPISESTVDSTMGIVSRNMVVNDDTTDGTFVGKRHTALNAMEVNNKKVGKNIGGENSTVVLAKNTNAGKTTVDAADTSRDFIYIPLKEPPRAQRDDIRGNNENCLSDENKVNDYQHSPRLNQRSSLCGSIGNGSGGVTDYYHSVGNNKVHSKPPLPKQPPRVVGVCAKRYGESTHAPRASSTPREIDGNHRYMGTVVPTEQYRRHQRPGTTMISENKIGLIETNLDTHETIITGKTQSLMELGSRLTHPNVLTSEIHSTMSSDEPKGHTKPPENELQKTHDTPLSEHQLRVQASLQRLNIPDWYKQYNSASKTTERTSGTNYRKRNTEFGKWVGLNSKTTSLSSLGSQKAEKGLVLLSPSSHSHHGNTGFSRWSTSHLNSTQTSPSISGRSSFSRGTINSSYMSGHSFINPNVGTNIRSSYRQPYLGWRSQEKLSQPRTPAERLASSLLSQQQQDKSRHEKSETENAEIQTSIKEVTSAIVHYVNDQNNRNSRSRSTSPSFRKCWLESSFVGIGPVDQSPQTPTIDRSFSTQQHQISRLATNSSHINGVGESAI
uniref:Uncharacterized protein n=2 Tax=Lutzomyia longipalpis TaxID=7200 RepID=A0A1B0EUB1_LUTLO